MERACEGCMSVPTGSVLKLRSATKAFRTAGTQVRALDSISLDIGPGEFVSIMGRSGSGKSTLLNVIGCLDELTDGQYLVHGTEVRDLSMRQITSLRNRSFGFVFQAYHLVSTATAIENVELPMKYAGIRQRERRKRATELLERFGITECATRLPTEMSGGQQQRVAIARAIANRPATILADEPTGNLDSASGEQVMNILIDLNRSGTTLIIVTHDDEVASKAQRLIRLQDGKVESDLGVR